MSSIDSSGRSEPAFNFTEFSTLRLLIGVVMTCVGLWAVIAASVGS